jgi:glycosyltransferase involved in cell wall biosynthesis
MRIGMVTDRFYPEVGGAENHVRLLAERLDMNGFQVKIITSRTGETAKNEWVGDLEVLRLTTLLSLHDKSQHLLVADPLATIGIRKAIAKYDLDLIHAHNTISTSAIHAARKMRKPVVATVHDTWGVGCFRRDFLFRGTEECTGRLSCGTCTLNSHILDASIDRYRECYRQELTKSGKLTAPSKYLANLLMKFGYPSSLIGVVPNFTVACDEMRRHRIAAVEDFDRPTILYVGALESLKGPQVLLRALSRVIAHRSGTRLHFVGRGSLRHSLTEEASRLGVSENVVFLGFLEGESLLREYASSSIVVVPSLAPEACPTVILEAMAVGKPVVASAVGGIPELVKDCLTGLLFQRGNSVDLARALERLLRDNHYAQLLGNRGREMVQEDFTIDKASNAYVEIYRQIAAG